MRGRGWGYAEEEEEEARRTRERAVAARKWGKSCRGWGPHGSVGHARSSRLCAEKGPLREERARVGPGKERKRNVAEEGSPGFNSCYYWNTQPPRATWDDGVLLPLPPFDSLGHEPGAPFRAHLTRKSKLQPGCTARIPTYKTCHNWRLRANPLPSIRTDRRVCTPGGQICL